MKKPEIIKHRKLTNREVLQFYSDLRSLKTVPGIKLNFAIARTIQSLKPLVEAYGQDLLIPKKEEFIKFEEELKTGYANIAADGGKKPRTRIVQTAAGEYETLDFNINGDAAHQLREILQVKFEKALEARSKQVKEYNVWLGEPCEDEYRIFMIHLSEMPESSTEDYKQLWDICGVMVIEEATETC